MKKLNSITLFTVGNDDYPEFRAEMEEDLVAIAMDGSLPQMMSQYKELLWQMYHHMDDDTLQGLYDEHIEYFIEESLG
jgi:hypothetical protein